MLTIRGTISLFDSVFPRKTAFYAPEFATFNFWQKTEKSFTLSPKGGGTNKKAGPIASAQIGVCMHTKEHIEPLIVRVSA